MEVLYTDLSLDFADNRTLKTIKIKQHDDHNRTIRIALFHKGQRITLDSNTDTAVINASVGGTVTAYHDDTGVGINNISNTVDVTLTDNLTTLAGTEHCEIMVSYTDFRINANRISHTATFDLLVEPSVANTDHQSILANTDLALNWAAELADINADIISLQSQLFELKEKISSSISTIGTAINLIDGNNTGVNTGAAIPEIHW